MSALRTLWRAVIRACCAVIVLFGLCLFPAVAQESVAPILTIDQNRLFVESEFGRASLERERVAGKVLEDENAAIQAELVAEEQDLTARRQKTATDEFAGLATAFDEKVERIRNAQDAKARDLSRTREADQQMFRRAAGPIIGKLMNDKGAVVVLDRALVILSTPAIDITDEAIVRIDAALGPGEIAPGPKMPAEVVPKVTPDVAPDPSTLPPVTPMPPDGPVAP